MHCIADSLSALHACSVEATRCDVGSPEVVSFFSASGTATLDYYSRDNSVQLLLEP